MLESSDGVMRVSWLVSVGCVCQLDPRDHGTGGPAQQVRRQVLQGHTSQVPARAFTNTCLFATGRDTPGLAGLPPSSGSEPRHATALAVPLLTSTLFYSHITYITRID